ncbi:uncharacterized protein PAC_10908 [Phialocephala subalpina]|uniref:C2H2-type domain-containing protein n=1 Tax=Phialocephala subalpina TaxID=576137 RepID=A0A1L7X7M3_9HELO|nr:uncharacterized protein PAC_10908 [Phialocephala subalpina]
MKRQGHTSLRRASLERISASLRKKNRISMDTTSTTADYVEREIGSSGIRTATHKTSHHQFLTWVTYSRDLSPDITEEQQRTCPVCESKFRDRRSMLQHICVLVDDSETYSVGVDSTRAAWERIELPSEHFAGPDARKYRVELATNKTTSSPLSAAELDGDWPTLDLNSGSEAWGPIELPPWQSAEFEEDYAGWPAVEMDGGPIPAEMPFWQPAELPGDDHGTSGHPKPASALEANHQEASNLSSLPIHEVNHAYLDDEFPPVDCGNIAKHSTDNAATQAEMPKQPNLRLETGNFATQWQCSHETNSNSVFYHNTVGSHVRESFPRYEEYSHNSMPDAEFPSPPTSPIMRHEHDTPVSPIENSLRSCPTSRSSRFSSLSSVLMDDTPTSSFSSCNVSVEPTYSSTSRVFEDREMCFEPDDMDSLPSSSVDGVDQMMYHNPEHANTSTSPTLVEDRGTRTSSFNFDVTNMSFQHDPFSDWNLSTSSASSSLDDFMMRPAQDTASFSPDLENDTGVTNRFDAEFSNTGFEHDLSSLRRSSGSDASWNPPSSTSPPDGALNSEEDLAQSPKSDKRRPLARSPAVRDVEVYKCTYGRCTFVPTGKRVYHKRTLQRHQDKCFYSPLPREKKPCKCTFPGCNKGFSRSDGLNAHRKTSGHQAKIELQFKEADHEMREEVGFL